jgi:hypothetical protein
VPFTGSGHGGFVSYRDRGEPFEWKLHGHDRPADLAARLVSMGFAPKDQETVLIAPVSVIAGEVPMPDGVTLREVSERADLDRIGAMEEAIWRDDRAGWLPDSLQAERAVDSEAMTIVVAEAAGNVVCAGWVRFVPGTDFATLWGGGTLPEWRRRGIYRAIVAYRASLAMQRGFRYLQVDTSANSRPILERLGFVAVTTTTPYVWTPPPA